MIIYSKNRIHRTEICSAANRWVRRKLISITEFEAITLAATGGYTEPTLLMRIAYFIFTTFIAAASYGIILFFYLTTTHNYGDKHVAWLTLLSGLILYLVAEYQVREKKYYRSGTTHALLICGAGGFLISLTILIHSGSREMLTISWFIAFVCLGLISIRFLSSLFALGAWISLLLSIVFLLFDIVPEGKAVAPFVIMGLSVVTYLLLRRGKNTPGLNSWNRILVVLEPAVLLSFYLAGNYFVVRNLGASVSNEYVSEEKEIPLAFFFYAYTVLIPIGYCVLGLKNKNRSMLQCGLLTILVGVLSIRYYHSFIPADIALTGSGTVLLLLGWLSIRALKSPRAGIGSSADPNATDQETNETLQQINQLILSKAASSAEHSEPGSGQASPDFGGGSGGGGGAGGTF
jgi:hypothetical protein